MQTKKITIELIAEFEPTEKTPDPANDLVKRVDAALSPWFGEKNSWTFVDFGIDEVVEGHLTAILVEDTDAPQRAQTPDQLVPAGVLREVRVRPGLPREWEADSILVEDAQILARQGWSVTWRKPGGPWVIRKAAGGGEGGRDEG